MATTTEAGAKGGRYRAAILDQAFFGQPIDWAASGVDFDISLHTAAPEGEGGRLGSELAYPGYQRVRLPRDGRTWQRAGNAVSNRTDARFALCQSGPRQRVTHWALTPHGEPAPAYVGAFDAPLVVEPGIRPVIDAGMVRISEW